VSPMTPEAPVVKRLPHTGPPLPVSAFVGVLVAIVAVVAIALVTSLTLQSRTKSAESVNRSQEAMRDVERFSCVGDPCAGARKRQSALFQNAIERNAVDKFHDEIGRLCGFLDAHVMQRDDVGVRELADDASFAQEAVASFALRDFGRENFDGHGAADQGIEAAHDAASGADAESFKELVATDLHGDNLSVLEEG